MVCIHCLWVFSLAICKLALIWKTLLWDWELHHQEQELWKLLEPDHPVFSSFNLILQGYPIEVCLLGLLKRANGDRKYSEVILACITSSHQRKSSKMWYNKRHLPFEAPKKSTWGVDKEYRVRNIFKFQFHGRWQRVEMRMALRGSYCEIQTSRGPTVLCILHG